jgi:hypothetical protein
MALPQITPRRKRQFAAFACIMLAVWLYGTFRHEDVVGWSRWDRLNQDGVAALDARDLTRAEPLLTGGLAEAEHAGTSHQRAISLHNLGTLRARQRRPDDADALFVRAIAAVRENRPVDETELALLLEERAGALLGLSRTQEALSAMDESVELSRRSLGRAEPSTVRRMRERAGILLVLGRVTDAATAATRATASSQPAVTPNAGH